MYLGRRQKQMEDAQRRLQRRTHPELDESPVATPRASPQESPRSPPGSGDGGGGGGVGGGDPDSEADRSTSEHRQRGQLLPVHLLPSARICSEFNEHLLGAACASFAAKAVLQYTLNCQGLKVSSSYLITHYLMCDAVVDSPSLCPAALAERVQRMPKVQYRSGAALTNLQGT